jgi:hypothetical protein
MDKNRPKNTLWTGQLSSPCLSNDTKVVFYPNQLSRLLARNYILSEESVTGFHCYFLSVLAIFAAL